MSLLVEDLTIARGGVRVLEGVSFTLPAGEALVLRGPNGIGKTTLLRTVAGLQPALSGRVEVDADSVAYAGHADGIKPTLSVVENLSFWAKVFGTEGIAPALEAFDLVALSDRPAGLLSAGQKRRLGLARLVLTGRSIWILDEPTVSLDRDAVAMFAKVVAGHLRSDGSALLASHIDLGLNDASVLDLSSYKAKPLNLNDFDEAFL